MTTALDTAPSLSDTPSSDRSLYFDAPVAHFHTPSKMTESIDSVHRQPTVANGSTHVHDSSDEQYADSPVSAQKHAPPAVNNIEQGEDTHAKPTNESAGWLPAVDGPHLSDNANTNGNRIETNSTRRSGSVLRKKGRTSRSGSPVRSASVRSTRSQRQNGSVAAESVTHGKASSYAQSVSKRSLFTNADGNPVNGSAFIGGAGVTGPSAVAEADDSLHQRRATAEAGLTPKQKSKITKKEGKCSF